MVVENNELNLSEPALHHSKSVLLKAVGKQIHKFRKERSMTGKELANLLNVSQQQISRYECGVCNITIDTLMVILHVMNVSLKEFFEQVFLNIVESDKIVGAEYCQLFELSDKFNVLKNQLNTLSRYNKSNLWG
ncbi:helix-turn-helix transcriptional regulator [Providencia stuartii]|uniref:helix-turn-helix domain-containing protein n=1 Tax=Providencia TaxID=586 RepID=UPI0027E694AA|nr:helix-turn-helix transcriptional regulator [Providencia sp. 2023EL-00965]ELR5301627.1 helix-turn-helix transcriptional regulator [Providencia stuartii]MDW7590185.1 helix-turn-helix transcriptional regulator [Providencia sp. 2023EL-00965]